MKQKLDLNAKLAAATQAAWTSAQATLEAHQNCRKYADTFRRISYFYDTDLYVFGTNVILQLNVSSLKEALGAMELIEDEHQVTFNKSSEWAAEKVLERTFKADGLDFQLDVRVAGDNPTCRSVLVGYEQTPKYEIRCDEEEAS